MPLRVCSVYCQWSWKSLPRLHAEIQIAKKKLLSANCNKWLFDTLATNLLRVRIVGVLWMPSHFRISARKRKQHEITPRRRQIARITMYMLELVRWTKPEVSSDARKQTRRKKKSKRKKLNPDCGFNLLILLHMSCSVLCTHSTVEVQSGTCIELVDRIVSWNSRYLVDDGRRCTHETIYINFTKRERAKKKKMPKKFLTGDKN